MSFRKLFCKTALFILEAGEENKTPETKEEITPLTHPNKYMFFDDDGNQTLSPASHATLKNWE